MPGPLSSRLIGDCSDARRDHPGHPQLPSDRDRRQDYSDGPVFTKKEHYDQGESYRDLAVPLVVAPSVVDIARGAGFTDIRPITPWESIALNGITVTGAPAAHAVAEVGFVIGDGTSNVYFAGDTLFIPELSELPDHAGATDVALLPTNGLRIRAQFEMQVVMDHRQAAQLTALLRPKLTMPHHYACTSDPVGDMTITCGEKNPQLLVDAVAELDPSLTVRVTEPGTRVQLRTARVPAPGRTRRR